MRNRVTRIARVDRVMLCSTVLVISRTQWNVVFSKYVNGLIFIEVTITGCNKDMTTEAFVGALKRFVSRRGRVANMYSDNGRNFVGADRELHQFIQEAQKEFQERAVKEHISWHFIPARSPHFGGLWESAVRAMKMHLKRTIGNASLTVTEMMTVLAQIEAIMNSRPITPMSDDPNDLSVLTPGHFLIGETFTSYPESDLQELPVNKLSRWQHTEQIKQHFWARWSKEYLTACQQRSKWKTNGPTRLEVGQLVMLKEDEVIPFSSPVVRRTAL